MRKLLQLLLLMLLQKEISDALVILLVYLLEPFHSLANYYLKTSIDTSRVLNDEKFDDLFKLIKKESSLCSARFSSNRK